MKLIDDDKWGDYAKMMIKRVETRLKYTHIDGW
jgi:hypothetical protein